jgi:hypothetical protein
MADAELEFRSQDDYVSKYRRVLEYFDATKIGLTATPALHTVQIFGEPIFTYSYREAVVDGYLIDHEPPIRIETALSRAGITFQRDEQLEIFDTRTGPGSRCLLALAAEGGGDRRECGLEIRAYNFNGADDNHGNQSEAEANGEFADR